MLKRNVDHRSLPPINYGLLGWFRWFVRGYLNKHFHSIAVNRCEISELGISTTDALVVYSNHASWWDPLTAIYLADRLFPGFSMYAPIDAEALDKYRMFGRMGFFGVEQQSLRGASEFLRVSHAILGTPGASLWLTPEGRFADVRDTSAELMPGLAHLAWRFTRTGNGGRNAIAEQQRSTGHVWFLPVAVEYPFWVERQPELLVWFGPPTNTAELAGQSKPQIAGDLSLRLRNAQHELAQVSMSRDVSQFELFGSGRSSTYFVYDWWQKLRSKVSSPQ